MICEREIIILVFALASSPRISLQRTFFAEQKIFQPNCSTTNDPNPYGTANEHYYLTLTL
jgi:hypothetical protein